MSRMTEPQAQALARLYYGVQRNPRMRNQHLLRAALERKGWIENNVVTPAGFQALANYPRSKMLCTVI